MLSCGEGLDAVETESGLMPSDLFSFSAIILAVYHGLSLGMFARW